MKWEYTTISCESTSDATEQLTYLGAMGWRVIACVVGTGALIYTLERQVG